ncbi:substrate-binding domain-containing protein [Alsobacter sp. R-9]
MGSTIIGPGEVAEYFLRLGIRDVAVIHGRLSSSATAERLAGFLDAMKDAGHPVVADRVQTGTGLDHLNLGHESMLRILNFGPMPRGLFCLSDLIAYGAHKALQGAAVAVPEDIAIVGFDENPLNNWLAPWLSSVRVPYDSFGSAIVRGLQEIWSGRFTGETILDHCFVDRSFKGGR